MAQGELFPDKCFGDYGKCRNKVRVMIPTFDGRMSPGRVVKKPSCVKHADEWQAGVLAHNASLVWALNRAPGEHD